MGVGVISSTPFIFIMYRYVLNNGAKMKLSLLLEGLSPTLYRYVQITEMLDTLKNNAFRMTNFLGSTAEFNIGKNKKYYFLSTARHKLGSYNMNPNKAGVMMVLDGRKLGQKYKGAPVDYWSDGTKNTPHGQQESEDRIYHDKSTIPNASKYIKEMHLFLGDDYKNEEEFKGLRDIDRRNIREFVTLAKKKGIDYYLYDSKRNWLIQNKKLAIDLDLQALSLKDITSTIAVDKQSARAKVRNKMSQFRGSKYFGAYIELYKLRPDQESHLTKDAKELLYRLKYDVHSYSDDVTSNLQNELHNSKKDFDGTSDEFISLMRKEKLATPKQMVMFLKNKWEAPTKEEVSNRESTESRKLLDGIRDELGVDGDAVIMNLQGGNATLSSAADYINSKVKEPGIGSLKKLAWKELMKWAMDKKNWA